MSRSRKKTPILGNCGDTEKQDKRRANRAFRRRINDILQTDSDPDVLPELQEVSSRWDFEKDGRHWVFNPLEKWLRK